MKRKCRGGDQTLGRDKKGRGRRRRGKNRSSVRRSQHLPLLQGVETRTSVLPPSSLCLSGISLPLLNASYDYRNFISFIRVKSKKFSIQRIDRNFITRRSEVSIDRSITIVFLRSTAMINIVIGKLVTLNSVRILSKACARSIDGVEDRFSPRVR